MRVQRGMERGLKTNRRVSGGGDGSVGKETSIMAGEHVPRTRMNAKQAWWPTGNGSAQGAEMGSGGAIHLDRPGQTGTLGAQQETLPQRIKC